MANQVDFKILPSDQFNVYSPQNRSEKVITYFTLLSKLRGDILSVSAEDDPNDIVSAYYSNTGGTQTLHLVKADGSEVTASQPQQIISGTVNYISKFTTSNDIGNSQVFDDGTNVGIGTTTMTHKLQLGTGGVFADYYQLDTTYSNGFVVGALSWDIDNGTMDVGLSSNLKLKVGQDDVWYVKNQTGSSIAKGTAVYASGTLGASSKILISPMIANGTIPAKFFLGIVAETIANGAEGYVLTKGKLRNINTSAYNEGDVLWVSPTTAGALTATEPTAPNLKLPVAFVVNKGNNGVLAIRATTGQRIADASDVDYAGASDNSFLVYNSSTGVWEDESVGIFKTIAVSGQSDVVADTYTDTLTLVAGTNVTITTNASTDSITINSTDQYVGTVTSVATTAPITGGTITTTGTIGITQSGASSDGYLSSTDWNTFNNKQGSLTFTAPLVNTSGTVTITQAGTASNGYLSSTDWNTFNNKASDAFKTIAVSGQSNIVADSATDTLTFEAGTNIVITTDAATDKITISAVGGGTGSVTSVDMSVPTGFAISGNPITTSGTLALAFASGYSLPTNASQGNWDTAYNNSITAFAYNTSTGVLTLTQQDAGTLTATVTLQPFSTTNLTEGTNLYFTTARARQSLSAGTGISYDNSTGVITNSAPDQIVSLTGGTGISTSGTYPSFTITNTLPDQTVVLTAGTGITTSGTYPNFTITNSDRGSSQNIFKNIAVAGQSTIVADSNDDTLTVASGTGISLATNATSDTLTITNTAPDQTVVLNAGTGISTSGTYPNFTITNTLPDQTVVLTGAGTTVVTGTYPSFTITSNDQYVGTVTSVATTAPITGGTITTSGTIGITQSTTSSDGYLSSTDWNTFNAKIGGSGTTNYVAKFTSGSAIGNSQIFDNGTNVGIGTASPGYKLDVNGTIRAGVAGNSSANIPALLVTSSGTGDAQAAIAIQQATSEGDTIIFADYEPYVEWGISTENAANKIQFTAGTSTGNLGSKTLYNNAGDARTAYIKFDHDLSSGQTLIGGNVGIGTTAPAQKLHVDGAIRLTSNPSVTGDGSSAQFWNEAGVGPTIAGANFQVRTNGNTTALHINSSQNVGIGTTAPTETLDLRGVLRVSRSGVNDSGIIAFGNYVNGAGYYDNGIFRSALNAISTSGNVLHMGSYDALAFTTSANALGSQSIRMYISGSTGNVGIDTTAPVASLDNQGSAGTYRQRGLTTMVTNNLGASGTQAKRYEIARASIDYNDWNTIGPIEVELYEKYYSRGLKKKYVIYYGYVSASGCNLVEMTGSGDNQFMVSIGSEVVISGDNRYIPIYVDVRYYSQVTAVVKTNRELTTANPPGIGGIWMNNMPTGVDISDFTADSTVYVGNIIGGNSTFSTGNVGIGTTAPGFKLTLAAASATDSDIFLAGMTGISNGFTVRRVSSSFVYSMIDGGLGINNAAPTQALHVTGSARVTGAYYDSNNSAGTSDQILTSTVTGTDWKSKSELSLVDGSGTANYVSKWSDTDTLTNSIIYDNGSVVSVATASPYSGLSTRLYVGYAQNSSVVNQNEFISVGAAGGSTNQAGINFLIYNALYGGRIYTDDNTVRGLAFDVLEGGTFYNAISITRTTSPNVGIGTTAPQKPLEAISGVNNFVSVGVSQMSVGNWSGIHFGYREANSLYRKSAIVFERTDLTANDAQGKIHILNGPQGGSGSATLADAKLTIAENGNVGIGTTAPGYKLDVSAAARIYGVRIGRDFSIADRATVRLDSNGNAPADILFGQTAAANQTSWDGVYWSISSRNSGAGAAEGNKFTIWRGDAHSAPNNSEVQFVTITPNLNFGIGTTAPSSKLHVYNGASSSTAAANAIAIFEGGGNGVIQVNGPDASSMGLFFGRNGAAYYSGIERDGTNLYLKNNSSVAVSVNSSSQVGIGSTSMFHSAKLSIAGLTHFQFGANSDIGGAITGFWTQGVNGTNYYAGGLKFYYFDNVGAGYGLQQGMILDGQGNFGIRVAEPSSTLHISTTGANAYSSTITNGVNMKGITNTLSNNADDMVGIYFGTGTNAGGSHWSGITGSRSNSAVDWGTQLNFYTHDENTSSITTATQKMVIKGSGNVGIGTTAPSQRLHVAGKGLISNAGITGTPSWSNNSFEIQSSSGETVSLEFHRAGFTSSQIWSTGNNLIFGTGSGTERMRVQDGNVGIGTTSPSSPFTVATDVRAASLNAADLRPQSQVNLLGGGGDSLFIGQLTNSTVYMQSSYFNATLATYPIALNPLGGNVGIGTTAPGAKLQVGGGGGDAELLRLSIGYDGSRSVRGGINWHDGSQTTGRIYTEYDGTMTSMVFGSLYNSGYNSNNLMIIRGNGNVGIGTTAPANKLDIRGITRVLSDDAINAKILYYTPSPYGMVFRAYGSGANSIQVQREANDAELFPLVLQPNGSNVGIGITAPLAKLHVQAPTSSTEPSLFVQSGTSGVYGMIAAADSYHGLIMRGIPSSKDTYGVTAQDSMSFFEYGGDFRFYTKGVSFQLDAQIASGAGRFRGDVVAFYSFSDERLKDDVKPLENSLDKVLALQGVSYKWNLGERKGQSDIGLIAQQVEKVVPEVVREKTNIDGDTFKSVNYEHLVGVLIEAIKEQQKQIDELKSKLK